MRPHNPAFSNIYLVSELMETDLACVIRSPQELTDEHWLVETQRSDMESRCIGGRSPRALQTRDDHTLTAATCSLTQLCLHSLC
jgi:hypothetical protein